MDAISKILIVCTTDSMIWNFLVPHIKHLKSLGFTVECACSRTGFYFNELENKHGIVLHNIHCERNPFRINNIKAYFKLCKIIRSGGFDIIYCHEPVGGMLGRIAGKRCGKYVMYIAHGFHFFSGAPAKHWLLYYTSEYLLSFLTDCMITICNEDYNRAKKMHAKKNYYIPGIGSDFTKFDDVSYSERENIKKELNLSDKDVVLITVGELSKRKNHSIILEALSKIKNHNIKLLICGEGDLQEELKAKVINYKLLSQVQFLGFRKDVPQLLTVADIFIFPSLWEGLGIAGIEAMYSGLPVIGSNRQGIKDYVSDGKTGYLFEPNDADTLVNLITLLSKNISLRRKLGDCAKQTVCKYSLDNSIKKLEYIYRNEIINKHLLHD